jgi:hypothetical protein
LSFGIFCGHLVFCGHLLYFVDICYILWTFVIFCGHLLYFVDIWSIFTVLVYCTKKNLATLTDTSHVAELSRQKREENVGLRRGRRRGVPAVAGREKDASASGRQT